MLKSNHKLTLKHIVKLSVGLGVSIDRLFLHIGLNLKKVKKEKEKKK